MCKNCEIKPVYEFTNQRKLCKQCFVRYFSKKFLYIVRKFKMIGQNEVVRYESKGDFRGVVLEEMLKMFSEKANVKLVKKGKADKVAVDSTLDIEAEIIVRSIIKKDFKKLKVSPVEGKSIRPLYLFLDKEVLLYARIRKLKFKEKKHRSVYTPEGTSPKLRNDGAKDMVSGFIDKLEKNHPEVKRAIVNSYLALC